MKRSLVIAAFLSTITPAAAEPIEPRHCLDWKQYELAPSPLLELRDESCATAAYTS